MENREFFDYQIRGVTLFHRCEIDSNHSIFHNNVTAQFLSKIILNFECDHKKISRDFRSKCSTVSKQKYNRQAEIPQRCSVVKFFWLSQEVPTKVIDR